MLENSTTKQVTTVCCSSECGPHPEVAAVEAENQLPRRRDIFDLQLDAHLSPTELDDNSSVPSAVGSSRPSTTSDERVAASIDRHQTTVNGDSTSERVLQHSSTVHRRNRAVDWEDKDTMLRRPERVATPCGGLHNENDDNGIERFRGVKKTSGIGTAISDTSPVTWSRYMNCRATANHAYVPTDVEHLANVITHGLWIAPSIVGLWWMTSVSTSPLQQISAIIYGLSLFCLFTVSTTFHALAYFGRFRDLQKFFHIGDRAVIYIFIASSYTPWLVLKDFHRWSFLTLIIVWLAAMGGIYYQYTYHEQYKWLETLLYIVVAMVPSIIIVEMKESSGLIELLLGGILYVCGLVFFKCDGVIPFAHAIWHSFVFIGASCHFVAVCRHLLVEFPPGEVLISPLDGVEHST